MKIQKRELGLISLDRLLELHNRVKKTAQDYKKLLDRLNQSLENYTPEIFDLLVKQENELLKTLEQRVKVFNSHYLYLSKKNKDCTYLKDSLNTELQDLSLSIKNFCGIMEKVKEKTKKEIDSVSISNKRFRRSLDVTAQRIEIIT